MSSQTIESETTTETDTLLSVESLDVEFDVPNGSVQALRDVSITVERGETLGIAGESGSGKSTLALAIVRYLDNNGHVTNGSIEFKGRNLLECSRSELRSIRGNEIAHVAQNAARALNPSIPIGKQIKEAILLHRDVENDEAAMEQVYDVLEQVDIPDPEDIATRYPNELSGGQQQRALIAIGLSCDPELLILDEPTTGLDVTTQAKFLDLVDDLKERFDIGIVLITHDLGVIANTADRVSILYAGEVMEYGPIENVFSTPTNPYTQALLATTPEIERDKDLRPIPGHLPKLTDIPDGCIFADRCPFVTEECRSGSVALRAVGDDHETRCLHWEEARDDPITSGTAAGRVSEPGDVLLAAEGVRKHYDTGSIMDRILTDHKPVRAVDGVDLTIRESETVGLVGESGCGKSTLGRTLLRLHEPTEGTVRFRGDDLASLSSSELREFRSECQIIQQDPEGSLNPRKTVRRAIERPLVLFTDLDEAGRNERIAELMSQVDLSEDLLAKYPHELSGGQQQRVAIARAFATNPSLVVLDEPVSALDVSVQARILDLLGDLRDDYDTSYLFISHDLSVIKTICDQLAVMYLGKIVENGTIDEVLGPPFHPYTRALLSSIPTLEPGSDIDRIYLEGDVPNARDPPSGCSFRTRCPQYIGEECDQIEPSLEEAGGPGHGIACHHDEHELSKPDDEI